MPKPAVQAIHRELKRLQSEGVDRVFVDDDTLRLIKQPVEDSAPKRGAPQKLASDLPHSAPDAGSPGNENSKPVATQATAAPSHIKPLPEQAPSLNCRTATPRAA